ncbi:MAG: UPF0182 family protein, partial [Acidobacteriaceae bacterium]|nr:UPF0182 family protein [Acidobacteriaceae bacterium]
MADRYIGERRPRRAGLLFIIVIAIILLICSRVIASTLIEYSWWTEVHQTDTWLSLLLYGTVPVLAVVVLFWAAFFLAFELGVRHNAEGPLFGFLKRPWLIRIAAAALLLVAIIAASATVDNWTAVRFVAGLRVAQSGTEYVDPIFGKPLAFYFFGLPFWNMLLRVVIAGSILCLIVYWAASNLDRMSQSMPTLGPTGFTFESRGTPFRSGLHGRFVRVIAAVLLLGIAIKIFFDRYDLLFTSHGPFLV